MKRSRFFVVLFLLLCISLSTVLLTACNKDKVDKAISADDEYTLTLKGLVDDSGNTLSDVVITKKQIKELFAAKPVVHTADNPAVASDKTDDNGNPIPHTVKGVYLEDLMSAYSKSVAIANYGSLTLNATDGYVTVATDDIFNSETRGSKMIVAIEYDGVALTEKEKSGALRAVFPNQIANVWAKKLNVIEFSKEILATPTVLDISVFETLDTSVYGGSYNVTENEKNYTFNGIKISKLIGNNNVFNGVSVADKMCAIGWDPDDATGKFNEYKVWTKYDVYSGGYILTSGTQEGDESWTLNRTPVFDGPDFSVGMTVKNILSLSAFHSAVVSMDTAMKRYDPDVDNNLDGKFAIKDLLVLLNMFDKDYSYIVTQPDGTTVALTYAQITAAKVSKNSITKKYELTYDTNKTVEFTKISVAE